MVLWGAGILGLLAYCLASVLLYGGPFQALGLLTIWSDRLGLPYWPALVFLAMMFAMILTRLSARFGMPRIVLPACFIVISMACSALMVGCYAEIQRDSIVEKFAPDVEMRSSVFASFRNAPRAFQFFLHGAALKDCKAYAWSYRHMAFYELPPNVAVNVLPTRWIEDCHIQRTR